MKHIIRLKLFFSLCILIGFALFSGCKKRGGADFAREIPPHATRPIVLYDVDSAALEYERFTYHWDTGTLDDDTTDGTTDTLGEEDMVCHTLEDLSRHTAWVKRVLPITVRQVLNGHDVALEKQDAVVRTVEAVIDKYLAVDIPFDIERDINGL